MDENALIERFTTDGSDKVWIYDAEPNEIDDDHEHDYDTTLAILKGDIQIVLAYGDSILNIKYLPGSEIEIPRNTLHAAKVGPEGCRYVVAEKHYT
jgi:quercetin dioxygenase-like cupin family protein